MDFRTMNLAVFERKPLTHVFFQPRFEPWLDWNKLHGSMAFPYQDLEVREVYRDVGCSMRYVDYYTGQPCPVTVEYEADVRKTQGEFEGEWINRFETPYGELVERNVRTIDGPWRAVEFLAKTPEDLRGLTWLFERTQFRFDPAAFVVGSEYLGDLGEPQFFLPKSPFQALAQSYMKLEDLIFALADAPEVVEAAMAAIDRAYDPLYEALCRPEQPSNWPRIINLGENLHEQLISPSLFERYYLPRYECRMGQLRDSGIFTHIHVDGYFSHLLPYLSRMPFDGIEALTPKPQGDLDLEAIAEHLGDKVLLDGIPAVLFMDPYTEDDLMACVERVVELFHPRLVLGISDELPEGAGEGALERVRLVADWCRRH